MADIILYVSKSKLRQAVGKNFVSVIKSLIKENFIKSYKEVIEFRCDKDKAIHIQSALAFYEVKDAPTASKLQFNREDD